MKKPTRPILLVVSIQSFYMSETELKSDACKKLIKSELYSI